MTKKEAEMKDKIKFKVKNALGDDFKECFQFALEMISREKYLCEKTGLNSDTIRDYLLQGLSDEEIISKKEAENVL